MPAFQDLTGKKFGRLTAIKRDFTKKRTAWLCKCECGNTKIVTSTHLKSGLTKSCGCLQKERAIEAKTKHKQSSTSLYHRWKAIKQRCHNPNNKRYYQYGGRGIKMCDEWRNDFLTFEKWAYDNGYKEELTLDRIDNDKGYAPSNCRWTSYTEQARNRSITVTVLHKGKAVSLGEISNICNINYNTLYTRYEKFDKDTVSTEQILSNEEYMLIPW